MSLRKVSSRALVSSAVFFCFVPPLAAEAQDVDVPGNLTMHDSTDPTVGNILKEGVPFLHNFGTNNTFLGSGAGNFTMTGAENTVVGAGALRNNTTGHANTASGVFALQNNTSGSWNTASGLFALYSNTTGGNNTASGFEALYSNTNGYDNTATGFDALYSNTTGGNNTASGFAALYNNTANANTASGFSALYGNTTGNGNTADGIWALSNNTTGSSNTGIGHIALDRNTTGSSNTALGSLANVSVGDLSNATAIGAGAVVDASNKVRLGNTDVTVIEGQVPYTYTSDRHEKENFRAVDAEAVLSKLSALSVTSWNYKGQDAKQFRHYGPMAQDFFAAFGRDAVGTIGTPTTITSGDLDGVLMVAAQALEKRTVEQEKEIEALRAENVALKVRLEALERRVGSHVAAEARAGF
jgi:trimeric autotransporter adhesin